MGGGGLRGRGARILLASQNLCNTPSSRLPSSLDRARRDVCARAQTRAVSLGDMQGLFFFFTRRLSGLKTFKVSPHSAAASIRGPVEELLARLQRRLCNSLQRLSKHNAGRRDGVQVLTCFFSPRCFRNAPS